MPYCQYCGKETYLPFRCKYCGGIFCSEHRLPEKHECPGLRKGIPLDYSLRREEVPEYVETEEEYEIPVKPKRTLEPWRPLFGIPKKPKFTFSRTEIIHLTIGTTLVVLVGLSSFFKTPSVFIHYPLLTLMFSVIFILIFLPHELAHKFTAQRYGLWAEFRLLEWGTILTLISILSPAKIIAPGAVIVQEVYDNEITGKIALAGPLTNLFIATILIFTYFLLPVTGIVKTFLSIGLWLNIILGIFNMLPISPLDGSKIMKWSVGLWALVFSVYVVFLLIYLIIL